MRSAEVLNIYSDILNNEPSIYATRFSSNPLKATRNGIRPNSASVEDGSFGDSGKGAVVAKLNETLMENGQLLSIRVNGGANAGHETFINGKRSCPPTSYGSI